MKRNKVGSEEQGEGKEKTRVKGRKKRGDQFERKESKIKQSSNQANTHPADRRGTPEGATRKKQGMAQQGMRMTKERDDRSDRPIRQGPSVRLR